MTVFAVRRAQGVAVIALKEKYYDKENSEFIFDEESVTAVEITQEELNDLVRQMGEYLRQQGMKVF